MKKKSVLFFFNLQEDHFLSDAYLLNVYDGDITELPPLSDFRGCVNHILSISSLFLIPSCICISGTFNNHVDLEHDYSRWSFLHQPFKYVHISSYPMSGFVDASDGRRLAMVAGGENGTCFSSLEFLNLDTMAWEEGPEIPSCRYGGSSVQYR